MNRRNRLLVLAVAAALLLTLDGVAGACPNCKESIATTADGSDPMGPDHTLPGGFNQSIYYMLGGLGVVVGATAAMIVRAVRASDAAAPPPPRRKDHDGKDGKGRGE